VTRNSCLVVLHGSIDEYINNTVMSQTSLAPILTEGCMMMQARGQVIQKGSLKSFVVAPSYMGRNSSFEQHLKGAEEGRVSLNRYHHFHGHCM